MLTKSLLIKFVQILCSKFNLMNIPYRSDLVNGMIIEDKIHKNTEQRDQSPRKFKQEQLN